MSDFDWEDLKALLAVVRTGRLTAAAKRLGIDHSTLSRRICGLETSLGTKLFDRRTGGYTLTRDGELLIEEAESIENIAVRIQSRLDHSTLKLTGCVRIGIPEGFGTYFLAPRLSTLTEAHPDLRVEIVASPSMFSLAKREADLAVTMARPERGHLFARKLTDYELGLYASRAYLKSKGPIMRQSELTTHPWVGYVQDLMWTPELDYFQQLSKEIEPRVRISNVITQMMAILGSIGLGVLPCFMAGREPELVRILSAELRLFRSYWMVTHSEVKDLARVRTAVEFIGESVQAGAGLFLPNGRS